MNKINLTLIRQVITFSKIIAELETKDKFINIYGINTYRKKIKYFKEERDNCLKELGYPSYDEIIRLTNN